MRLPVCVCGGGGGGGVKAAETEWLNNKHADLDLRINKYV